MSGSEYLPAFSVATSKRTVYTNKLALSTGFIFLIGLLLILVFSLNSGQKLPDEKLMSSPDYNVKINPIPGGFQYHIEQRGVLLNYRSFLENMRDGDIALINLMSTIMRHHSPSHRFSAVFWECHPVTLNSIDTTTVEFVLLDATSLASKEYDITAFQDQFGRIEHSKDNGVVSFFNLGKDALLVVPAPSEDGISRPGYPQYMTHLAAFHEGASDIHIFNLWRTVGSAFLDVLESETDKNKKFWLSTSGLGVSWLHIRVDLRPKYYNYVEYKVA